MSGENTKAEEIPATSSDADSNTTTIEVQLEFGEEEVEVEVEKNNNVDEEKAKPNEEQIDMKDESIPSPNGTKTEKTDSGSRDKPTRSRVLGIMLAFFAAFMYAASSFTIKLLKYNALNLGVWRFTTLIFITIPFLVHGQFYRKKEENKSNKPPGDAISSSGIFQQIWPLNKTTVFLILQAIVGSSSIVCVFFGLTYLNLGDSAVICTSAPVFVTIVAWIFLKEPFGFVAFILPIVSLIGVGIICKPPFITGGTPMNIDTVIGVSFSLGSMILLTFCYIIIRYLRKVHHALIQFSFAVMGLLESLILGGIFGVIQLPSGPGEAALVVLNAILAFTAQTLITLALKYEQAGVVALVRMTEVVFCYFWQAVFLNVQPDLFSIVGAVVTLSCVLVAALRKIVMSLDDDNGYKKYFKFLLY